MSIDRMFISALLKQEGFSVLSEYTITDDMLMDADKCRSALEIVKDFYNKHAKMPEMETIEAILGVSIGMEAPEPLSFYAELVHKRWIENTLISCSDKFNKMIALGRADEALTVIEMASAEIKKKATGSKDIGMADLTKNTQERMDEFLKSQAFGNAVYGLPIPWPAIHETTLGLGKAELWFIVAGTGMGKSWVEVMLSISFFRDKKSILLVTMEMPISKIAKRVDAVFSKLPYGDFKRGRIDSTLVERYSNDLKVWADPTNPSFYVCGAGRVRTPQDLDLLIGEVKPDVVLVDGVYLMGVSSGKVNSKWEKVGTISNELKHITTRRNIPIIGTTQFNRKVKKETLDAGTEALGFASELGQDCDVLLGLFQTDEMRVNNRMRIKLIKNREGEPLTIETNWDFSTMSFEQVAILNAESLLDKEDSETDNVSY